MNFLFPAFLLAAAAIAIPILLHFRRQPPQKAVPFSTLMFLEQTPVPPRTRRKLEDWLLLALRCLALVLLAMMFARPFFRGERETVPATGTRWCVLLDTSASMQRPGAWDAAAKQFDEATGEVSEEDSVELVAFDRAPRVVVSAQTWRGTPVGARKGLLKSAWAQIKPTWAGTDLGKALLFAAGQLTENSEAAAASARIVLISDMQEGASIEALHAGSWPEGVSVTPRVVTAPWQDNFSLSPAAAMVAEEAAEVPKTGSSDVAEVSQLRVRVTSSRDSKNEKFSLMWKEGGERVEATIPAGGSRILPAPPRVRPDVDGMLELRGDTLDFDNRIHVARPHVREVEVLCLGDDLSRTDTTSPFFYLSRALGPTPVVKPTLTAKAVAELTAADLLRAQIVLIFGDAEGERAALLKNWVAQGNALVSVPATAKHVELMRAVTGETGLAMKEAPGDALLQDLRFEHPMLSVFGESGVRDFTRIRFWKHRVLEAPEALLKKADVLAKFDDGSVAWAEFPVEKGKMLCLTSGWSPSDSQLAVSSKFVPLAFGLLDWALGDIATPRGGVVGDAIAAQLGNWTGKLPVVRPDGKKVTWDADAEAQFTDTDVPGIYRIGEGAAARSVAVNLATGEGRVAPMDEQQLVAVGVKLEKLKSAVQVASDAMAQLRLEDAQHEQRQKGWKMLLLAALVVLVLETWLAGRREGRAQQTAPAPELA